jgi:excisionase family DNA binding protein
VKPPNSIPAPLAVLRPEVAHRLAAAGLPEVATVEQVAVHLQLAEKTVRALCARGELRSVTVARRIRILRVDVDTLLGVKPVAAPPVYSRLPDRLPDGKPPGRPRKKRRASIGERAAAQD